MSPMPALRRKTAGAFAMLLCAVPMTEPCLAQPAAPQPAPQPAAPQPAAPQPSAPQPSAPVTLSPPDPAKAPPAASPVPSQEHPAEHSAEHPAEPAADQPAPAPGADTAAPPEPEDRATATKPAKTEEKAKPGPGANDAGRAADLLRTAKMSLVSLMDRTVIGRDKGVIGHVIDVLVDAKGQPAALVVDAGGILGVGNRRIAIAWERFALAGRKPKDALQLPLTDAQVKAAPAYDGSEEVTVVQGVSAPPAMHDDQPPAGNKPAPVVVPGQTPAGPSRVDLGTGSVPPPDDTAPAADPLNPD